MEKTGQGRIADVMKSTFYVGNKVVLAYPMTKEEYVKYRGWELPKGVDPKEKVYLIEYEPIEGKVSNMVDEGHDGYVSMSPKHVFDEAYRENGHLDFGSAILAAKRGEKITRSGWNGKGMYVVVMSGYPDGIEVNEMTQKAHNLPKGSKLIYKPYFQLYTAQKDVTMWTPTGLDALAEDWEVLN